MSALLKHCQCSKYIQFSEDDTSNHWPEVKKTQKQPQKQLLNVAICVSTFSLIAFLKGAKDEVCRSNGNKVVFFLIQPVFLISHKFKHKNMLYLHHSCNVWQFVIENKFLFIPWKTSYTLFYKQHISNTRLKLAKN